MDKIIDVFDGKAIQVGMDEVFRHGSDQSPPQEGEIPQNYMPSVLIISIITLLKIKV